MDTDIDIETETEIEKENEKIFLKKKQRQRKPEAAQQPEKLPEKQRKPLLPAPAMAKRKRPPAGRKILCKRFSTKSRMALESRADSGLNPLITESHGGQNGMRAGTA